MPGVAVHPPAAATLQQGQFTLLHAARFQRCRVAITAISNDEFGGVLFRVTTRFGRKRDDALSPEVFLRLGETLLGAKVEATTPAGVTSLDVAYVVRTGADA